MRPLRIALVTALLLTPAIAAGCLTGVEDPIRLTPYVSLVTAEPGRTTQFAVHVASSSAFRTDLELRAEGLPTNWTFEPESRVVSVDGRGTTAFIVNVTPAEDARHGLHTITLRANGGATPLHVNVGELGPEPARDGVGAQVYTVGFWDNGTIFYTNMKEVRDNARLPWTHLDEDAGADENMRPIKAYVGDRESGRYPPEPYNSSGYVRLIDGFDARMRADGGMRGGETWTVRIPPEQAYTKPGYEEHRLYGDAINFVIHVVSVDVLEDERVCLPDTDVCVDPENPPSPPAAPRLLLNA